MATPATSFLQLLAQASQGAMEGYDYGQKQQQQRQELARQQAQDGMQRQLQMAQLAGYQRQADQAPLDAERQARMDAQAAEQQRFTNLQSLIGTLGQNVERGVMNPQQAEAQYRQANPAYRGSVPLFQAPPVSADTAARTGAQVQTAQIRAGAPRAAQPRYITNDQGQRVPDGPGVRVPARGGAGGGAKPKSDRELALEVKDEMTGLAPDSFASSEEKAAFNKEFNARLTAKKRARDNAVGGGGKPALTPGQQAIIDALKGK